jgi:hypothetical protein
MIKVTDFEQLSPHFVFESLWGLVVKVSTSQPKDREFEQYLGYDLDSSYYTSIG